MAKAWQSALPLPPHKKKPVRRPQFPALAKEDMRWLLEPMLLSLIDYHGHLYGYQLFTGIADDPFSFVGFAKSSVYTALRRFEEKGLVVSYWDPNITPQPKCRAYELTDSGRDYLYIRRSCMVQLTFYANAFLHLSLTNSRLA